MSLTPIRSNRYLGEVMRGTGEYFTACERFVLLHPTAGGDGTRREGWRIDTVWRDKHYLAWAEWLSSRGLLRERFDTRAGAVSALESTLREEGLLDADHPPT